MGLFINRLSHIDVSLWCPTKGLVGCSWQVDAQLDGELGEDGMLFDFGEVKPWIKRTLDSGIDHTLLVPIDAPGIKVTDCAEGICIRTAIPYEMEVRGPAQAFTLLPWNTITVERVTYYLSSRLAKQEQRPANVHSVTLMLSDESIDGAAYGYTHGLKQHLGNCQRIAHGHRSRLLIWQHQARQPALEQRWAAWLDNQYLLEQADIESQVDKKLTCRYQSSQGTFSITLPQERCCVLPKPTTVENIALWLAKSIAEPSGHKTLVQAFEGIDKGATAETSP